MITKKDNLLLRPWQERRYENHRQKVNSALPVIDARPPPFRGHVCTKLKKKQSEKERCVQIERDNLRLLQKMESIMKRNRLDNHWTRPQPTFLHRINLYHHQPSETEHSSTYSKYDGYQDLISLSNSSNNLNLFERPNTTSRKHRCTACCPQSEPEIVYEERLLPWEQEIYNKIRHYENYELKVPKITPPSTQTRRQSVSNKDVHVSAPSKTSTTNNRLLNRKKSLLSNTVTTTTTSLILNRGNLNLAVNFPSDTQVSLRDGDCEKVILKRLCKCKNSPTK